MFDYSGSESSDKPNFYLACLCVRKPLSTLSLLPSATVVTVIVTQLIVFRIARYCLDSLPRTHHYHRYDNEKRRRMAAQIAMTLPKFLILLYSKPFIVSHIRAMVLELLQQTNLNDQMSRKGGISWLEARQLMFVWEDQYTNLAENVR
jgi:hypothetical protein